MSSALDRLLFVLRTADVPLPASALRARLGVSQPTISRMLARAGSQVVRVGRGRATRYAASRDAFGQGPRVPLYAVDASGMIARVADLWALATGRYFVEADPSAPAWLLGNDGSGLFESLPYFLFDLRPSGFLGRRLARQLAAEWGFPGDPRNWQDLHIGQYLIRRGEGAAGHLLLGELVAQRLGTANVDVVRDRSTEYPRLALSILKDGVPGSSAAGEQPKLAVCHEQAGHVIVKFSPAADTAEATRWRDLLRAEAHALAHLRARGLATAETNLLDFEGRVFLESRRFDRQGRTGRLPSISLGMVDAEFAGVGQGWAHVGQALRRAGVLDEDSADRLAWLETFGAWIGNTDMHLGNISLCPGPSGFSLHPVYDMLPMALAPVRGELPDVPLRPPIRSIASEEVWATAGQCAADYWLSLADQAQLSADLRSIAASRGRELHQLLGGPH